MPAFRDFDAALAERREHAPTFRLDGFTFTVPPLAAELGLEYASTLASVAIDDPTSYTRIKDFLATAVAPEQAARMHQALAVTRPDMESLVELLAFVMEATTGRPTSPPSASPASPSTTSQSSTDALPALEWAVPST